MSVMEVDVKKLFPIINHILAYAPRFDQEAVLFMIYRVLGIRSPEDQEHLRGILKDVADKIMSQRDFMQELALVMENPAT